MAANMAVLDIGPLFDQDLIWTAGDLWFQWMSVT